MTGRTREWVAAGAGLVLVIAAFVVPRLHLGNVTPLINSTPQQIRDFAQAAPIFGWWNAHVGWGSGPAVLLGSAVVLWGPSVFSRIPRRALPWTVWATSFVWAFALAMIDGWQCGFAERLTARHEYLRQVPTITDIPEALRDFSSRILDFQPNSWMTHVSGHPPGALLTFVWLDRIGLSGGAWAGLWCLLIGSSAAAAIVVTVRVLSGDELARTAAPFVAVAPTAIWIAVSADGYYAGVAAWGVALLAMATRNRRPIVTGAAAGLVLGWGIFLNYGLVLMALPAVAVLLTTDRRTATKVLSAAVAAALAVVAAFALAGFWWFDGYTLVQQRYWQGIAVNRPFQYWVWANLASVVCAVGLGTVAGMGRVFDLAALRQRSGLHLVVLAALVAILCADLSMLSKAETERIWLPFTVWLAAAGALLPASSRRWWLALNVLGALALNHLILTNW